MKRTTRGLILLGIIVTLFFTAACSVGSVISDLSSKTPTAEPPTPMPTSAPEPTKAAATVAPTKAGAATTAPTKAGAATAAPTTASGTPTAPDIGSVSSGLDKLDSYAMTIEMTITGKDAQGKAVTQAINMKNEIIKSKNSMHFSLSGNGLENIPTTGSLEVYQIDKTGYMTMADPKTNKTTCLSYSGEKPAIDQSSMIKPDEMFSDIQAGTLVAKGETVNGVKADHYKLKKAALGSATTKNEDGDMWVSQDGGYLVKVTASAEGDFDSLGSKVTGKLVLNYNLTNINKVTAITLPKECADQAGGANSDLPVPTNATDQASLGGIITFSSPDAPKTVGDYYRKQVVAKGWKIASDSSMDALVMLTITKDTRTYSIMITTGKDNKGSSVVISPASK